MFHFEAWQNNVIIAFNSDRTLNVEEVLAFIEGQAYTHKEKQLAIDAAMKAEIQNLSNNIISQ
jgi:hypothetical protein